MDSSSADVGGLLVTLTSALTPLTACATTLLNTILIAYRVSILLGQFFTHTLLTTFQLIFNIVQGVVTTLIVLFEDFRYFASDVEFYLSVIFSVLLDGLDWLLGIFLALYTLPSSFPSITARFIKEPFEAAACSLINLTWTLKASLILIGEIFWDFTVFSLNLMNTLFILTPISLFKSLFDFTTALGNFIWNCISDVPFESACGLVIAYFSYYAFISFGGHYILLAYLYKIASRAASTLYTVYLGFLVTLHIVMWRLASSLWRLGLVRRIAKILSAKKITANPLRASLIVELELERAEKLCVACMDKKKTILMQDCNHLCLCMDCAEVVYDTTGQCPICRAPIINMVNVYV